MKLTRIRLEQFKQFRKPVEITALDAGINLFTGPNEAGKSTIVAAVRAAFFERHRSSSVDDLRPWGDASASPTVELEFSIKGTPYRLTKSFLSKKHCELQAGAQRLDGALAEDHLAELLGFQYAGKGASAAQHWGIPGLLWIQQGAGQDIKDPVTHATDHLRNALNESLGEVASSGGDDVLAAVEAQRNELLTPASGAPRGVYAEAIKRQTQLDGELKVIDADVAAYRQKVDLLATLRRDHAADEAQKPWAAFREQEQQARDRLTSIERVQSSLAADRQRVEQLDAQLKLLRGQLETFDAQETAAKTRASDVDAARQALSAAGHLVEQWAAQTTSAAAACDAAREGLRQVRLAQTRAGLVRELDDLRHKTTAVDARLQQAEAEQAALLELQAQAAAAETDPSALKQLRKQGVQLRELQIQRAAVATRLRFNLAEGRSIQLGDEVLSGTGERLLLAPVTLQLASLGEVEISPGGADLAELGRQESALSDQHVALLQQLGLASLDAAEARHQVHTQRAADVKTAAATLKALAPMGVDALRTESRSQAARAKELETALGQLPAAGVSTGASGLPTVSEAESVEEAARLALEQINTSLSQARVATGNAQATFDGAQREHRDALSLLQASDRAARLQATNQALVDARAEQSTLASTVKAKADEVALARPDILKQDIERYQKSADQLAKGFEERKTALLRVEVELQSAGAQGLEERRAALARDLAQGARRAEELRRRAVALDHLLGLLKDKRGALTRKLQAPLQKHLNHYLQLLFPAAHLEIDENLSPGPLTRNGPAGPESGVFEALSFGAREQMGVISRLAYADLLREAGRPTLIILDDALVHSDDERLSMMKRVLFDAATRHQMLLFTCHPEKWRDVGVKARSLDAVRASR
ncbi:MAG: AAA family ATPase [Burkholderiales bacterium]